VASSLDVGISHDAGYITGEKVFASLASIDAEHAEPGTEVTVIWGEEPNAAKPTVEPRSFERMLAVILDIRFRSQGVCDLFLRTRGDGLVGLEHWDGRLIRAWNMLLRGVFVVERHGESFGRQHEKRRGFCG
jgi:hypothetical protein